MVLTVALILTPGCGALNTARKVKDIASGKALKRVEDYQKRAEAGTKLTFTADYEGRSKGNQPEKIHIAQKPPKSLYQQGDTTVVDDGTKVFICSPDASNSSKIQCLDSGAHGTSPQGFVALLSTTTVFAGLSALAIVPGIDVKETKRDVAGEKLDCIKASKGNDHIESCVTKDGILGFTDDGSGNIFTLTSFKRSASDSDFKLPGKIVTQQDLIDQATSTTSTTEDRSTTTTSEDTTTTTEESTTTTSEG